MTIDNQDGGTLARWNAEINSRRYLKVDRDALGRPTKATERDGTRVTWEYDETGNLAICTRGA